MIKDFEYQNYLCVVPGQNLSIAGRFGDSIHGYDMLEINLIKCENTSDTFNCASEAELEKFYTLEQQKKYGVVAIRFKKW